MKRQLVATERTAGLPKPDGARHKEAYEAARRLGSGCRRENDAWENELHNQAICKSLATRTRIYSSIFETPTRSYCGEFHVSARDDRPRRPWKHLPTTTVFLCVTRATEILRGGWSWPRTARGVATVRRPDRQQLVEALR